MTSAMAVEASSSSATALPLEPEDSTRAQIYRLLAGHLSAPPGARQLAAGGSLLGDRSELGQAIDRFASACRATTPENVADEHHTLFIGLVRGELMPYASYYLTGFLQEKPLARLRGDMNRLGLMRDAGSTEPEDHAASILEMMSGLIDGKFGPQLTLGAQKLFFESHVASWMSHFFRDLGESRTSELYSALGDVGRLFLDIEAEAFRMV